MAITNPLMNRASEFASDFLFLSWHKMRFAFRSSADDSFHGRANLFGPNVDWPGLCGSDDPIAPKKLLDRLPVGLDHGDNLVPLFIFKSFSIYGCSRARHAVKAAGRMPSNHQGSGPSCWSVRSGAKPPALAYSPYSKTTGLPWLAIVSMNASGVSWPERVRNHPWSTAVTP